MARARIVRGLSVLLLIAVVALGGLGWAGYQAEGAPRSEPVRMEPTPIETTSAPPATEVPTGIPSEPADGEVLFFAARRLGRSHLWALLPGAPDAVQLTGGDWDDQDPAVSPDGTKLAFASNRDGGWDLYLLELSSGAVRRLTTTPGYEGHPTWSPDGLWVAYQAYYDSNFDIWILPVDGSQSAIQLTNHQAADTSPSWDPNGRRIAFISDRTGQPDVLLADLDSPDNRFINLTQTPLLHEADPAFDSTGSRIAYSMRDHGIEGVWIEDLTEAEIRPEWVGIGGQPAWTPNDSALSAILRTPQTEHVVTYPLVPAAAPATGSLSGNLSYLSWTDRAKSLALYVPPASPTALYEVSFEPAAADSTRVALRSLPGVRPAGVALSDKADEAFLALRDRTAQAAGWDFLGTLDYGFVGVNDPLPPGFAYNDWLYTGRAFAISQAAFQAGWVEVVREDFGAQTYWRLFVRTAAQDGTLGTPLMAHPWDFSTRYGGDPLAYDQGGTVKASIPEGYYLDLTELAGDYGFERLPALHNWRTFFPAARFGEFALIQGLDWTQAMLELYPLSAIVTPTPYQTPTQTPTNTPRPTPTPWWWRWRTPTPTATPAPPTPSPTP